MKNKGQAIVEFAIILPILILLLMGIIEFGLFFNTYLNITFASKEGARIASLDTNASNATILASIKGTMPSTTNVTLTVTPQPPRVTGTTVTVTVSTNYTFITPVVSSLMPSNPYNISAATSMRSE